MASGGAELDVLSLKVSELRDELKQRGLLATGVKAVLVERLTDALEGETRAAATTDMEVDPVDAENGDHEPPLRETSTTVCTPSLSYASEPLDCAQRPLEK